MIFVCMCLGLFAAWLFRGLAEKTIYEKLAAAVLFCLMLILLPSDIILKSDAEGIIISQLAIRYVVFLAAFVIEIIFGTRIAGAFSALQGFNERIFSKTNARAAADDEDEDFMKTKYGKIVMAVCILLVIYMFASAVCIFKLNQKINTVYEITQEMNNDTQKE